MWGCGVLAAALDIGMGTVVGVTRAREGAEYRCTGAVPADAAARALDVLLEVTPDDSRALATHALQAVQRAAPGSSGLRVLPVDDAAATPGRISSSTAASLGRTKAYCLAVVDHMLAEAEARLSVPDEETRPWRVPDELAALSKISPERARALLEAPVYNVLVGGGVGGARAAVERVWTSGLTVSPTSEAGQAALGEVLVGAFTVLFLRGIAVYRLRRAIVTAVAAAWGRATGHRRAHTAVSAVLVQYEGNPSVYAELQRVLGALEPGRGHVEWGLRVARFVRASSRGANEGNAAHMTLVRLVRWVNRAALGASPRMGRSTAGAGRHMFAFPTQGEAIQVIRMLNVLGVYPCDERKRICEFPVWEDGTPCSVLVDGDELPVVVAVEADNWLRALVLWFSPLLSVLAGYHGVPVAVLQKTRWGRLCELVYESAVEMHGDGEALAPGEKSITRCVYNMCRALAGAVVTADVATTPLPPVTLMCRVVLWIRACRLARPAGLAPEVLRSVLSGLVYLCFSADSPPVPPVDCGGGVDAFLEAHCKGTLEHVARAVVADDTSAMAAAVLLAIHSNAHTFAAASPASAARATFSRTGPFGAASGAARSIMAAILASEDAPEPMELCGDVIPSHLLVCLERGGITGRNMGALLAPQRALPMLGVACMRDAGRDCVACTTCVFPDGVPLLGTDPRVVQMCDSPAHAHITLHPGCGVFAIVTGRWVPCAGTADAPCAAIMHAVAAAVRAEVWGGLRARGPCPWPLYRIPAKHIDGGKFARIAARAYRTHMEHRARALEPIHAEVEALFNNTGECAGCSKLTHAYPVCTNPAHPLVLCLQCINVQSRKELNVRFGTDVEDPTPPPLMIHTSDTTPGCGRTRQMEYLVAMARAQRGFKARFGDEIRRAAERRRSRAWLTERDPWYRAAK